MHDVCMTVFPFPHPNEARAGGECQYWYPPVLGRDEVVLDVSEIAFVAGASLGEYDRRELRSRLAPRSSCISL